MNDPLHGITLKALLVALVERHGWEELARRVPIRCFQNEPTLNSSLKFLRKTPWARAKVEALYVREVQQAERKRKRNKRRAARRAFAGMPLERPETLAFVWPPDTPAPSPQPDSRFTLHNGVDREGFRAVQQSIGFEVTDGIWDGLALVDEAMVVARSDQGPVAVACAEHRGEDWVELAWVAVTPDSRGHGLGRAVCSALLSTLLEAGHTRIMGSTQDGHLEALRIYLGMGFRPVQRPDKAERWARVLEQVEPPS